MHGAVAINRSEESRSVRTILHLGKSSPSLTWYTRVLSTEEERHLLSATLSQKFCCYFPNTSRCTHQLQVRPGKMQQSGGASSPQGIITRISRNLQPFFPAVPRRSDVLPTLEVSPQVEGLCRLRFIKATACDKRIKLPSKSSVKATRQIALQSRNRCGYIEQSSEPRRTSRRTRQLRGTCPPPRERAPPWAAAFLLSSTSVLPAAP